MPKFSALSLFRLQTCHDDLITLFTEVIRQVDCTILEGYRGQVEQEKAFNTGKSKLHFPHGKHNSKPSNAVDAALFPLDWADLKRFYFFSGYVLGIANRLFEEGKISHRIRWGGDWNSNYDINDEHGLSDLVHYEIIT